MNIDEINEMEALDLLTAFKAKFNWRGSIFIPEDIENALAYHNSDLDDDEKITVEDVLATWTWNKGMNEILTEQGFNILEDACNDATFKKVQAKEILNTTQKGQ